MLYSSRCTYSKWVLKFTFVYLVSSFLIHFIKPNANIFLAIHNNDVTKIDCLLFGVWLSYQFPDLLLAFNQIKDGLIKLFTSFDIIVIYTYIYILRVFVLHYLPIERLHNMVLGWNKWKYFYFLTYILRDFDFLTMSAQNNNQHYLPDLAKL